MSPVLLTKAVPVNHVVADTAFTMSKLATPIILLTVFYYSDSSICLVCKGIDYRYRPTADRFIFLTGLYLHYPIPEICVGACGYGTFVFGQRS